LTEYMESVRNIERRIQLAEAQDNRELPKVERPAGIPDTFEEHVKLMYDLMLVAYQSDMTRVSTLMYGREKTARPYPEIGVPEGHHPLSHTNRPDMLEKLSKINAFHVKMFAYFLERLRTAVEGDSNLLDRAVIIYGSGMGDGNAHSHMNLPILVMGGGAGSF